MTVLRLTVRILHSNDKVFNAHDVILKTQVTANIHAQNIEVVLLRKLSDEKREGVTGFFPVLLTFK